MSGFVIFVFVLTFAYVVYFAVIITLDLHGKKSEKKSDEETFDVSSMDNEEVPVSVEEHSDDSEEGDMTYTEQVTDDGLRVVIPTGNNHTNSSPPTEEESQSTQQTNTTSTELNKENEENMEEIEPDSQCCFFPDEFMKSLNDKHNKRKIERKNAIDKL